MPAVDIRDRAGRELARLYRLALEMGSTDNAQALAEKVLDTLLAVTSANIGAILLLPQPKASEARAEQLQVAVYKSASEGTISGFRIFCRRRCSASGKPCWPRTSPPIGIWRTGTV